MKKYIVLILTLFGSACDPVETGDPPVLDSFTVTAISSSQIEVAWNADDISDDFIPNHDLRVVIWFSETEDPLDLTDLGLPHFITGEGALSFTLVGLEASTSYQILARAADRDTNLSENENTMDVSTLSSSQGFKPRVEITNITASMLIGGRVESDSSLDNLGAINGSSISWFSLGSNDTFSSVGTFSPGLGTIRDAKLVPMIDDEADHLFVISDEGLVYYTNSNSTFTRHSLTFEGVPVPGSFTFRLGSDDLLEAFSYVAGSGSPYVYRRNTDADSMLTTPFLGHVYSGLSDSNALVTLAKLDDDDAYDLVLFSNNTLSVALASNVDLSAFESAQEINTFDSDSLGSGPYLANLFVENPTSTVDYGIYVFVRNESVDLTKIFRYEPRTGEFDVTNIASNFTASVADYDYHFYERPLLVDVLGDGVVDLLVPQTSANNVALYSGPSFASQTSAQYFGIDGIPDQALILQLNGGDPDLVIYDETFNVITALLSN